MRIGFTSLFLIPFMVTVIIVVILVYRENKYKIKRSKKQICSSIICIFLIITTLHILVSYAISNHAEIVYTKDIKTCKLYPLGKENILIYYNNDNVQCMAGNNDSDVKIKNINIKSVTINYSDMGTITRAYPEYKSPFLNIFFVLSNNQPMYFISVPKNTIKTN